MRRARLFRSGDLNVNTVALTKNIAPRFPRVLWCGLLALHSAITHSVRRRLPLRSAKKYDALIIGSGASGGMAAKELTERGFEVLVLEAGPPVNPQRDFSTHTWGRSVVSKDQDPYSIGSDSLC